MSAHCIDGELDVSITLSDGTVVEDVDRIVVASNDFLATGGDKIFTPVTPPGGFDLPSNTPLFRDHIALWLNKRGGEISSDEFYDPDDPRYDLSGAVPISCD